MCAVSADPREHLINNSTIHVCVLAVSNIYTKNGMYYVIGAQLCRFSPVDSHTVSRKPLMG